MSTLDVLFRSTSLVSAPLRLIVFNYRLLLPRVIALCPSFLPLAVFVPLKLLEVYCYPRAVSCIAMRALYSAGTAVRPPPPPPPPRPIPLASPKPPRYHIAPESRTAVNSAGNHLLRSQEFSFKNLH